MQCLLQYRRSALVASLILGVLIAVWHLPLMVVGQVSYSDIVLILAAVIVFNWVFNNARGSVLIIMLMHAANNAVSGSFFSPMFSGADSTRESWFLALVWIVVAVLVIVICGPRISRARTISRRNRFLRQSRRGSDQSSEQNDGLELPETQQIRSVIMSSRIKWGGIAGIVAAALFIVSAILEQLSPLQRIYDSVASYLYLGVVVAAYIAVIIAVLGIHALHSGRPRYGRLGTTGTVLTIAGYLIMIVLRMIGMVAGRESLGNVRIGAGLAVLIGSVLLGVIILRARILPWWCGVLLIVAFPLGDVANAIFRAAENLLLALLWGSVGVALLARREGVAEPAVTQPAQAG
jgi:Type II CAAX prenyl endopeptidase Rce1-like